MTHFELKKSEIKKAVKKANEINNCKDCTISGYYTTNTEDQYGFISVVCEVMHNYEERADFDVVVECFMEDRRSSFAHA